jgi:hypothetical protein
MQASCAIGLRAGSTVLAGNLAQAIFCQVGMVSRNRPIDEPDFHIRAAAGSCHQRRELD